MRLRPNRRLIVALALAIGTSYYYFGLLLPQARLHYESNEMTGRYRYGGDFYPIWLSGRELLFHGVNPYTAEMTRAIQIGLFGRPMDRRRTDPPADFRAFAYPLYADLLAVPLLPLSFEAVRIVLGLLLPPLTAAGLILWLHAFSLRLSANGLAVAVGLFLVSYPVLEGLYALQAGLLIAVALALAVASIVRGRMFLAGILLAAGSVKPQVVWLVALWLLLWAASDWITRKGLVLGFCSAMVVLFAGSQLILPGWLGGWWHSLAGYSHYTVPALTELVLGKFLGMGLALALLALAAALCWRMRHEKANSESFSLTVSFVLAVTVILEPYGGAVYDHVILVPAIAWLAFRRAEILNGSLPMRVLALIAIFAIGWQWILACGVAVMSLVSSIPENSPAVLVLPTRMAAPLPFVLLALLSFFAVRVLRRDAGMRDEIQDR